MNNDDEIRAVLARVKAGDQLWLTLKPGEGENHRLTLAGFSAVRYLALRHHNKEFVFPPEHGAAILEAWRSRQWGTDGNRTFQMLVPQNFQLMEFADAVYEQLEAVAIVAPATLQGEDFFLHWLRRMFPRLFARRT